MGKKKSTNNNNKPSKEEPVVVVADAVIAHEEPIAKVIEAFISTSTTHAESQGESPAASPVQDAPAQPEAAPAQPEAAPAQPEAAPAQPEDSSTQEVVPPAKPVYVIVSTPREDTASQRITGYYRRRDNNERTQAEADEEEAYYASLPTMSAEERTCAERAWSFKPAHILMDVAFLNMEKFNRLFIESEVEGFTFMIKTDMQRERLAIAVAERNLRIAADALSTQEGHARVSLRKEAREEFGSLIIDKDTARRAVLAAEREAKRKARAEVVPLAPEAHSNYDSATIRTELDAQQE